MKHRAGSAYQSRPKPRGSSTSRTSRSTAQTPEEARRCGSRPGTRGAGTGSPAITSPGPRSTAPAAASAGAAAAPGRTSQTPSSSSAVRESARDSGSPSRQASYSAGCGAGRRHRPTALGRAGGPLGGRLEGPDGLAGVAAFPEAALALGVRHAHGGNCTRYCNGSRKGDCGGGAIRADFEAKGPGAIASRFYEEPRKRGGFLASAG